jgi:hypothetical protein
MGNIWPCTPAAMCVGFVLICTLLSTALGQSTPRPEVNACFSTTQDFYQATITMQELPQGLTMVNQLFEGPTAWVQCATTTSVSPYGRNLPACTQAKTVLYYCWSTQNSNFTAAASDNKTFCRSVTPLLSPIQIGDINGPSYFWALFVDMSDTPAFCFPRTAEVAVLSRAVFPTRGSVLLMVVVGIVLLFLILCGCVFGGRGLKQRLLKFLRRGEEEALDLRPDPIADGGKEAASSYYSMRYHDESAGAGLHPPVLLLDPELDTSRALAGRGDPAARQAASAPQLEPFSGVSLYDMSLQGARDMRDREDLFSPNSRIEFYRQRPHLCGYTIIPQGTAPLEL